MVQFLLTKTGLLKTVKIKGVDYSGKSLFDKVDQIIRQAYFEEKKREKLYATDFIWYLWCGPSSPPFDKDRMTTFERYFIAEKETHKENKGYYYQLKNNREICEMILNEFGVEDSKVSHIINGHIPVKTGKGESPIKAGGKLLVIDGGYSKAYQPETGIAGYTLIYNSHGLMLVQHEPFESAKRAIEEGHDIISETTVLEFSNKRRLVRDTDIGAELMRQIEDLTRLLAAYRSGYLKEDDN